MKTVEKSLDILEAVLRNKEEMSIVDLAKSTNQSVSTTHRICATLTKRGYLFQKNKGGKYSLGYKFALFSSISNAFINIRSKALPYMKELSDKISETVALSVLDGLDPIDIVSVVPDSVLKAGPWSGTKTPFHCTSMGKVFLANMPSEIIDSILNQKGLEAYTEKTITDVNKLKTEIDAIRKDGVAFEDEEFIIGVRSTGAPIRNELGEVFASVCFLAPTSRLTSSRMKQLAPLLKQYALKISKSLGYKEKKEVLDHLSG